MPAQNTVALKRFSKCIGVRTNTSLNCNASCIAGGGRARPSAADRNAVSPISAKRQARSLRRSRAVHIPDRRSQNQNGADRQLRSAPLSRRRGGGAAPESQTLTSGTFGTVPRARRAAAAVAFGPGGLRRGAGAALRLGARSRDLLRLRRDRPFEDTRSRASRCRFLVLDDDDAHMAAALELAEQHLVGERLLDVLLDHARHRPRAHLLVVAVARSATGWPPPTARW